MTDRDVRDLIRVAFEGIAERHGVARSHSHACALELIAALTGHGIRLVRPAHLHDPAADWRKAPEPGDHTAGLSAVRAAAFGTGLCPVCDTEQLLRADGTLDEHEALHPELLEPVNCPGWYQPPQPQQLALDIPTAPDPTTTTTKADT